MMGFAIIYFTRTLTINFNLNIKIKTIILIFLFPPTIKFYNILLTEPLSYSFALLFVTFVIKLIYGFNKRNMFWCTFFASALVLMRSQFVFLYPVIFILYLVIFMTHGSKKLFLLGISLLSIFLISFFNSSKQINKTEFTGK